MLASLQKGFPAAGKPNGDLKIFETIPSTKMNEVKSVVKWSGLIAAARVFLAASKWSWCCGCIARWFSATNSLQIL